MKTYKNFEKEHIGDSDIASLVLVGNSENGITAKVLPFGMDGQYSAYIVSGKAIIGAHYKKVAEFKSWMKIYDDEELTRTFRGEKIIVYRAGKMSSIIQIFNELENTEA